MRSKYIVHAATERIQPGVLRERAAECSLEDTASNCMFENSKEKETESILLLNFSVHSFYVKSQVV